jgi:predicted ester cyclase
MSRPVSHEEIESTVLPFYRLALTVNPDTTPTDVLGRILADDFESISAQGVKTRTALSGQIEAFWRLIPDLRWEVQDVVASGDKVVVRSIATGTPKGTFLGVETDGTRAFRIDTIDIHELAEGRVARVHHVEDWASALRQVRS